MVWCSTTCALVVWVSGADQRLNTCFMHMYTFFPVVSSNGGTRTHLFWALKSDCAVAVFMQWEQQHSTQMLKCPLTLSVMHFSFVLCVQKCFLTFVVLPLSWEYQCTRFCRTLSGLPKIVWALKLLFFFFVESFLFSYTPVPQLDLK